MNMIVGFKSVIKYPLILVLPIVVQVMLSFVFGFGILLGVDLQPFTSFRFGETPGSDVLFQFTLPVIIPLIEDMNQSLSFLPSPGSEHWFLITTTILVYQAIMSFTIAMYLGSIKKVLFPERQTGASPIQMGAYYFRRIFWFQLFFYLLLIGAFFLLVSFLPLGILLLFLVIIFSLTPYLIVLEDKSLGEALSDSPTYLKRYFVKFIPLAFAALLATFVLSLVLQGLSESTMYYMMLVGYTFIGSGFIAAFMYLLDRCIRKDESEMNDMVSYRYPRWKKVVLLVLIFLLPWLGITFAKGKHVMAISFHDHTTVTEGITFKANWSDAFYGSDHTVTTYGFEQEDALDISMALPDPESEEDSIYGKGELTWLVDQEKITRSGNSTVYSGEEVITTSDFIYRVIPAVSQNGKRYYTSVNGGVAELLQNDQTNDPISMDIFVMNEGNDIFVFQYKERFDPYTVIRVDEAGTSFVPMTSQNNPEDYKYFWYSKDPMTTDRLLDFLHTKNKEMMHIGGNTDAYSFEHIVAAFLQEADGEALIQFEEEMKDLDLTTNIGSQTAGEWSEIAKQLYGDVDLTTFLSYVNQANESSAYEEVGWEDEKETNEYQVIVPFPNGDVILHCAREEGELVDIDIELPAEE